jgi:hypothetical protein
MKWFLLAFVTLTSATAAAQSNLVFFSGRAYRAADLEERNGQIEQRSLTLAITPRPVALSDPRTMLTFALVYRRTNIDLDDGAAFADEPTRRNVNAIDMSFGVVRVLNQRWSLIGGVTPGLRSDFENDLSSKDFQIAGYAFASYLIGGNPRFRFFFGLTGQTHASLVPILPIAGITYNNDFFFLQTGLQGIDAFVRFSNRVEVGAFGSFGSDWYRVQGGGVPNTEFLRLTDIGFGPMLNVRTVGKLWIHTRGGYAMQRRASLGDADREYIRGVSLDPKAAPFIELGASFRL